MVEPRQLPTASPSKTTVPRPVTAWPAQVPWHDSGPGAVEVIRIFSTAGLIPGEKARCTPKVQSSCVMSDGPAAPAPVGESTVRASSATAATTTGLRFMVAPCLRTGSSGRRPAGGWARRAGGSGAEAGDGLRPDPVADPLELLVGEPFGHVGLGVGAGDDVDRLLLVL